MISTVRAFLKAVAGPRAAEEGPPSEHDLRVATAALLVEVMRMDQEIAEPEREAVIRALRETFDLDDEEIHQLMALADREAREAPGYYNFTSLINRGFDAHQKARVIEYMWQVAYADGRICAHENHLMRKIADLLHVGHGDYCAAKERARAASENARGS